MNTIAYAYKNKPEFLKISSSGGAFLGIVETIFSNFGKRSNIAIYGAKWTEDFRVVHDKADCMQKSMAFCGSKYVQSDLRDIYTRVETDLRHGMLVLFSGTPCQIAAVRTILKAHECSTENLLTVDIVCHGAPKPEFWDAYRKWLEQREGSKLIKFSFRYKPRGWKGYPTYAEFENGKKYKNSFHTSHYMTIFRKKLLMRPGCFNCIYPGNFESDITIGDFWGVELCMPKIKTNGGVSLVLCHTEKGRKIAELMRCQRVTNEDYLKYNNNLTKKTEKPYDYEEFWQDYHNNGIDYVLKEYGGNSFTGAMKFYIIKFLRYSGLVMIGKRILKKA